MDDGESGGFGFGFVLGGALGLVVGAWLASGPGRDPILGVRARTIELGESARRAAVDPESPVRRALQDGLTAARRRRQELEKLARAAEGPVIVTAGRQAEDEPGGRPAPPGGEAPNA